MVPPPPKSTLPNSAVWKCTCSFSKIIRIWPKYSALASLEPDFPLAPVNLLNTMPLPRYATFFLSKLDAKDGSKALLTSEESIQEDARHLLTFSSLYSPASSITSATIFSKNLDCIPVAPTLPISSLSTRMQQAVLSTSSISSIAFKEENAHTLSSCPYERIMLLSNPASLAFPAGTTSSSAEIKSSSSIS